MSEENLGASGSSEQPSGSTENQKKDVVKYETYAKTLGEVKSLKQRLAEFEAKEQALEQQKLEDQGKYKELLESKNKKLLELEKTLGDTKKTFTKKVFTEQAKAMALQLGAIPEAADDLIRSIDWNGVEIDENFSVNGEQLKSKLAEAQETKHFYFAKKVNGTKDVNPSFKTEKTDPLKGKSIDELSRMLAEMNLKK